MAWIVAIPLAAYAIQFQKVAILTGFVLVECGLLVLNRGRCSLTGWAARYTEDRAGNCEINFRKNWPSGALEPTGRILVAHSRA